MNNSIFDIEDKFLTDNLNRIDLMIAKINDRIDSYKYEIDSSSELDKSELLEKKFDMILELNRLKAIKKSPYFGHLVLECDGSLIDVFVSNETVYYEGKFITYDYRNPICTLFYNNDKSFKFNNNTYKLKSRVKLIIEDGILKECFDENYELFNTHYFSNRDIYNNKTINCNQNEIIRLNNNKNVLIKGINGSGKSTTLLNRISNLIYNYPGIKEDKYLYITDNKFTYNKFSKSLNIEKVDCINMNQYYYLCLNRLFKLNELNKYKVVISNELIKDKIEDENNNILKIYNKYLELCDLELRKYKTLFNYNLKEFNDLSIHDKYINLGYIINEKLRDEQNKIDILKNNIKGWLECIYYEVESSISNNQNSDFEPYKYENNDNVIHLFNDFSKKIQDEMNRYGHYSESNVSKYIKLNDKMNKNLNTVINTIRNNNINISFKELKYKCITESIRDYKDKELNSLNEKKEELKNIELKIENFVFKKLRKYSYNRLIEKKNVLEKEIKDIEYILFILIDIEKKYIISFEDIYVDMNKIESKVDKSYLNLNAFKNYYDLIYEFVLDIFKYDRYIKIDEDIRNKMIDILNIFNSRFNNKVKYYNFVYTTLLDDSYKNIVFNNIDYYGACYEEIKYKSSSKYILDIYETFNRTKELNNIELYKLFSICIKTGYFKNNLMDYKYIFIDDIDNYHIDEFKLVNNSVLDGYFNISSNDVNYLKNINKIIDCKIYNLNINYRNTINVLEYCNKIFELNNNSSNIVGEEVKEIDFVSNSDILNVINELEDCVLIGNKEYLDYYKVNGIKCIRLDEDINEYKNVVFLDSDISDELRYKIYSSTLNNLVIIKNYTLSDTITDLEII